jgi:biofilm PGA synthesis protein PgaA
MRNLKIKNILFGKLSVCNGRLELLVGFLLALIFMPIPLTFSYGQEPSPSSGTKTVHEPADRALHDPASALKRAQEYVKAGELDKAIEVLHPFSSAPKHFPEHASDYIVILTWTGQGDKAIVLYEALPASFPRRAYLRKNIAKAYYDRGHFARAADLYGAVISLTPEDMENQRGYVLALAQDGKIEESLQGVNGFLSRNPDSDPLIRAKAEILALDDRFLEAVQVLLGDDSFLVMPKEKRISALEEMIRSLSDHEKFILLRLFQRGEKAGDASHLVAHILLLAQLRDYKGVKQHFESAAHPASHYDGYTLSRVAWAYFKTEQPDRAKVLYETLLHRNPHDLRAKMGLAYCLAAMGQIAESLALVQEMALSHPQNREIYFARAFAFEKGNRFLDAVREYDQLLQLEPGNDLALRLRILALSDMGATTLALAQANKEFPLEMGLQESLFEETAVDRIHWEETEKAVSLLTLLYQENRDLRVRYDYMIALVREKHMEEAARAYECLISEGHSAPFWVKEEVAGAYLYLEKPEEALALYDEALDDSPQSFAARMGKFYTLQDLREWDEAHAILGQLDEETPSVRILPPFQGKMETIKPHWPKLQIAVARGWAYLYEDRLREGQNYFWNLHEEAPADEGIRNGLAHTYLWRGWPRKALKEFQIIETTKPEKFYQEQPGMIMAMNQLAYKKEAREDANHLLTRYPRDKNVLRVVRNLEVEDMMEFSADVFGRHQDDETNDFWVRLGLSRPVTPKTQVYAYTFWRDTRSGDVYSDFRRLGAGIEHLFNQTFKIRQEVSANYTNASEPGFLTRLDVNPNDYLFFGFTLDYFTADVPMRARAFGIDANRGAFDITYRESEWRSYSLVMNRFDFSDGNIRDVASFTFQQGLFVKNDWMMRLYIHFSGMWNSIEGAPYYNPKEAKGISLTHMTQHTVWRLYERAFIHRLYLSGGFWDEYLYGSNPVGALRYEQDHVFSDTQKLIWGVSLYRNIYDGKGVSGIDLYVNYQWRF